MDACIQKAMLCMQVPSITAVGPIVTEKQKNLSHWTVKYKVISDLSSKPDLEIINTNILSKMHDDHFKTVTAQAFLCFGLVT